MTNCPIPIGEIFANKYRVERVLGEGGMGVVVHAHHLELDQPVAVKFLLGELADNPEGAERFRREARAAAKIQSDHVVRVLDVGVLEGGERYMVMEYLDGRDLSEEIAQRGTLPVDVACGYVLEALDAVGQAHQAGIIHRDLKPANLFLAQRPDGNMRVKVLDFGISKAVGSTTSEQLSLTKTSAWIGSPLYMSPEQMQSARDVDARSDIWSMGAILYELLVGRPPYEAESLPQLCNLLLTQDATPIEELRPDLPPDLAGAVMKCLVRDPEGRTQSVSELAWVLSQHAGSPAAAVHDSAALARTEAHDEGRAPAPSRPSAGTVPAGAQTAAAWGGTGSSDAEGQRGNKRHLLWAALGVLAMGLLGLALLTSRPSAEPEEEEPAVVESPASAETPLSDAAARPVPPPAPAPPDETTSKARADRDHEQPKEEKRTKQQEPSSAPQPAPKPAPKRQPRAVPRAPAPSPAPRPQPQPDSDGLSDFGGRR